MSPPQARPQPPTGAPRGPWWVVAVCVAISAAAALSAVLAYHATRPAPLRLATVNVAQLFNERQEELMKLVAGGGESGTQQAMAMAQAFGKALEAQVLALPQECGCIVLVRGALVAGGDLPDYTDLLRQRLRAR